MKIIQEKDYLILIIRLGPPPTTSMFWMGPPRLDNPTSVDLALHLPHQLFYMRAPCIPRPHKIVLHLHTRTIYKSTSCYEWDVVLD